MAIKTFSYPAISIDTTGLATDANQALEIAELQDINANTADVATETTLSALNGKVPANLTVTSTRLLVDGSGVTQPISATNLDIRDLNSATDSVSAVVSGSVAVTATDLDIRDLNSATDSVTVLATNLDIRDLNSATDSVSAVVSGTVTVTATNLDIRDLSSASDSVAAAQSGTWNIADITGTVSLPTGAATSANQTTGNNSLSSIDGKLASNYGVATGALRTAAQIGNASGVADFGAGNSSAQTIRTVIASDQAAVSTRPATPVTGTITQAAVTVGTSAVRITVAGTAPNAARKQLVFQPEKISSARFYFGSSSVTSSGANRGIEVIPGQIISMDYDANDYYIISDTAAQTVLITEVV